MKRVGDTEARARGAVSFRLAIVALSVLLGCGPALDREATLDRLRAALTAEVSGVVVLEDHNRLAEDVSRAGMLEGLFQRELVARLGRGQNCGTSALCAARGFRPTDWLYDVGHAPGDPALPAGPTLLVGFDGTGRVDRTFSMTRRPATSR
jgi:hypothetical protein